MIDQTGSHQVTRSRSCVDRKAGRCVISTEHDAVEVHVRSAPRFGLKHLLFIVALGLTVAALLFMKQRGYFVPETVLALLRQHPTIAPVLFVSVYAIMVFALLPTLPMNLAAGFLWGTYLGTLYTVIGATLGALLAFLTARYLLRDHVLKLARGRTRNWLATELAGPGWKTVAFTRVNPIFPFGPVNWLFGVSAIRVCPYFWATFVFVAPPAMFIAAIGASVGSLVLAGETRALVVNVMTASAVVTAIAFGAPLLRKHLSRHS